MFPGAQAAWLSGAKYCSAKDFPTLTFFSNEMATAAPAARQVRRPQGTQLLYVSWPA